VGPEEFILTDKKNTPPPKKEPQTLVDFLVKSFQPEVSKMKQLRKKWLTKSALKNSLKKWNKNSVPTNVIQEEKQTKNQHQDLGQTKKRN